MDLRAAIITAVILLLPPGDAVSAEKGGFESRLEVIESQRDSVAPEVLEEKLLKLLGDSPMSDQKGRVYAAISRIYRRDYLRFYRKVIKYSRLALVEDLDPITHADMELAQGRAMHDEWKANKVDSLADARKRLVRPNLRALKTIAKWLFVRRRGKSIPGSGAMPNIAMQGELKRLKKRAFRSCVILYTEEPYASGELRDLAMEVIGEENIDIVDELMAKIESTITWREEIMSRGKERHRPKMRSTPRTMPQPD